MLNAADKRPVAGATIDFSDCRKGVYQTDVNGILSFRMEDELNCRLFIRMPGFTSAALELSGLSIRNSKNFEVELRKEGEQYVGIVIDVDNRMLLSDVRVQAILQETGQIIEDVTDEKGEYVLALSNDKVYQIRYSKVGYTDINRTFSTGSAAQQSLLGAMTIRKISSNTPIDVPNVGNPLPITPNVQMPPVEQLPAKSYSIQVAAAPQVNLNQYAALNTYGNVYYMNVDNNYKVRVGAFISKTTASKVLSQIRGEGYTGAFLVEEMTQEVYDKLLTDDMDLSLSSGVNNPVLANQSVNSRYKIQLGAYQDTKNFNATKVNNLGTLEKKQKDNLTLVLLSGYNSIEEARKAMEAAKKVGFTAAFIVTDEQGELKRVKL
ncbi:MAG: hypothetical protein HC892_09275 [Saprospiraceae bacterium]|nr:hypothetical protein [Saprospiraceae bacterium]